MRDGHLHLHRGGRSRVPNGSRAAGRVLWLLAGLAGAGGPRSARAEGPSFRASIEDNTTGAGPLTTAFTVPTMGVSTTNRYLTVGIMLSDATTTITSVTYAGAALTYLGDVVEDGGASKRCRAGLYGKIAPATGANNIVTTFSGSGDLIIGAVAYTGVHQTTPVGSWVSTTGTSASPSIDVPSIEGDFVIHSFCIAAASGANTGSAANSATSRWDSAFGTTSGGAGATLKAEKDAATTTTTGRTGTSGNWGLGGIAIKKATGAAVRVENMSAWTRGQRVRVAWRTGFELDNLGYDVYRDDGATRYRITPTPIAGSALLAGTGIRLSAGRTYFWDDDLPQRLTGGVRYWIEEIDMSGRRSWHGPVSPVAAGPAQIHARAAPEPEPDPPLLFAAAQTADDAVIAPPYRVPSVLAGGQESPTQWALAGQASIKIGVDHEGWYEVGQPALLAAGLDPAIDPRNLALFVAGQEVPVLVRGEMDGRFDAGDGVQFYGVALNAPATGVNTYWLSAGAQAGKRLSRAAAPAAGTAGPARFAGIAERRPRSAYFAALRNGDQGNFFGPWITTTPISDKVSYRHLIVDPGEPPLLDVGVQGVSLKPHDVTVEVGGQAVGSIRFVGRKPANLRLPLFGALPEDGSLEVTLRAAGDDSDVTMLDHVRLEYPRALVADDGGLVFSAGAGNAAVVTGFQANDPITVLDVTDAGNIVALPLAAADATGALALTVPGAGTRTLLARSEKHPEVPASVAANRASHWNDAQPGADLVVIGPAELLPGIEPLKRMREAEGWTVALVNAEDVYDEYSFGIKHADALRAMLARARQVWTKKPRAVILVGDASFDARGFLGKGQYDLLPTKLLDTDSMETASDDWFTDFDDDGIADVPIGRLPVRTAGDLTNLVGKLVAAPSFATAQEAAAAGPLLFVNGPPNDGDGGNDFTDHSLITRAPGPWKTISVDQAAPGAPAAVRLREAVLQRPQLVSYLGHGSEELWPGGLLSTDTVAELDDHGPGAFWASYSCFTGFFHDVYKTSLAEALLAKPTGGAFGMWASSSLADVSPQVEIGQAFTEALLYRGVTVGQAAQQAKLATTDLDVRRTWILFGDPTWRLVKSATPLPGSGADAGAADDAGGVDAASGGAGAPGAPGPQADARGSGPAGDGCACRLGSRAAAAPAGLPVLLLLSGWLGFVARRSRRRR